MPLAPHPQGYEIPELALVVAPELALVVVQELALVVALVVAFSYLMVSELPMFSLKFKSLAWRDNAVPYVFLLGCAVLVGCFGVCGAAFSIVWYIVLSAALACRNRRSAARG